ncbi:hypothetical protein [Gemmobacter serpentinus]|uniref:hypothetical protein n=1 Tax=Gemmobacter serpentinus TaxID=2652247 RepID=UPI00124F17C6|nr:hypothetical protein [Gemmobacter serpentinus]
MPNVASLSAAEIEQRVREIGTPVAAPLVMPKQVLESARPLHRSLLALLHLVPVPRQDPRQGL